MFTLNRSGCCLLLCWLTVSAPVSAQHTVSYIDVDLADRPLLSAPGVAAQDAVSVSLNVSGPGRARLSDQSPARGPASHDGNGVVPAPALADDTGGALWRDRLLAGSKPVGGYYESGKISTAGGPFQSALCGNSCLFDIDYFVGNGGALAMYAGPAR
jgi:hypothetical protein